MGSLSYYILKIIDVNESSEQFPAKIDTVRIIRISMTTNDLLDFKASDPQYLARTFVHPPVLICASNEDSPSHGARHTKNARNSACKSNASTCASPTFISKRGAKYDIGPLARGLMSSDAGIRVPRPKLSFVGCSKVLSPGRPVPVQPPRKKGVSCTTFDLLMQKINADGKGLEGGRPPISVVNMKRSVDTDLESRPEDNNNSSSSDQSFSLDKIIIDYAARIRTDRPDIYGNADATGRLLGNFFSDLMKAVPNSREPLEQLRGLALSLCHQQEQDRNLGEERRLSISPTKHKVIGRSPEAGKRGSQDRIPTCFSHSSVTLKEIGKGRNSAEGTVKTELKVRKKQSCMLIPKLNLEEVPSKTTGYNEEFLSKIDQFSQSWRKECLNMKTCEKELEGQVL